MRRRLAATGCEHLESGPLAASTLAASTLETAEQSASSTRCGAIRWEGGMRMKAVLPRYGPSPGAEVDGPYLDLRGEASPSALAVLDDVAERKRGLQG